MQVYFHVDKHGHHVLNIQFRATDKNSQFLPSTSSVNLSKDAVSSLMELQVIVNIPLHMRKNGIQITPLMHAVPRYKMLTGSMANNWNGLIRKNSFTVGDINSDFNSIQACLNAAPAGSFITVHSGLYNESIVISKSVTLASTAGLSNTFLIATVTISASHITLDGFTIKSNSRNEALLKIEGKHIHIQNCNFTGQYLVDQPIDLHKVELTVSCHNCRHVKILNNIFFHCMFALSLDKVKHVTIRSNIFSYGYTSIVFQGSAAATDVHILGNLFEFNRAIVWLDNSSEAVPSFTDNVYDNNLQSDVCWQYENQIIHGQRLIYFIPIFGELKDLECHHLNIPFTPDATIRDVMTLPEHVIFKGWCANQVDEKQTAAIPEIEEQLYTQSGCISLLGTVVATVYPQGTLYLIIIVLSFTNGYCHHYGF